MSAVRPRDGLAKGGMIFSMWARHFKLQFDRLLALLLLVLFGWLLIFLYVLVRVRLGKPVFFKQSRIGYLGKPFDIYKFRTMSNCRDEAGHFLPDHVRLQRLGHRLRELSLDELPQIFNVLRGDMSFIGPRPFLEADLSRLSAKEKKRRRLVRPGITGWAQVNGRNSLSWAEKFKLDLWYVEQVSFVLDMKIFYLTCVKVCKKEGVVKSVELAEEDFHLRTKKR